MLEIDAKTLHRWIAEDAPDFELIDVREESEYEVQHLGGRLVPLSRFEELHQTLPKNKILVIHCQKGLRSANFISRLLKLGFSPERLYNLRGGMLDYLKNTDTKKKP